MEKGSNSQSYFCDEVKSDTVHNQSVLSKLLDCRKKLTRAFENEDLDADENERLLEDVDISLNSIRPSSLMLSRHLRTADGEKASDIIKSMKIIVARVSYLLDKNNIALLIKIIQAAKDPFVSKAQFAASCFNIFYCLNELQELLHRADGTFENNLHVQGHSPFMYYTYSYFVLGLDEVSFYHQIYDTEQMQELSHNCKKFISSILSEQSTYIEELAIMDKFSRKAKSFLNQHRYNVLTRKNISENSLKTILRYIALFLSQLTRVLFSKNFNSEQMLISEINDIIGELSTMLYRLPLSQVLNSCYISWMIPHLKDIIYLTEFIYEEIELFHYTLFENFVVFNKTLEQLLNICLKQQTKSERAVHTFCYGKFTFKEEESSSLWHLKFVKDKSTEEVLRRCPDKECCVCYSPFSEILEDNPKSGDLAVLSTCFHLVCVQCMENIMMQSDPNMRSCPMCRTQFEDFLPLSSYEVESQKFLQGKRRKVLEVILEISS